MVSILARKATHYLLINQILCVLSCTAIPFFVQFLANQLVILSLLKFQMLLTLSPFFPPSLLLSLQGTFWYLFKFFIIDIGPWN
jgi:hypothetical protein